MRNNMKPSPEAIFAWYYYKAPIRIEPQAESMIIHWDAMNNEDRLLPRRAIQEIKAALGYKKRGHQDNDQY
jgi:hypothetical protein